MNHTSARQAPHARPDVRPFNTVLVANRGEIACRIIRTLRRMGIRSVAVYSDADAGARHVLEADTAVRIGPAAAAESYLNIDALVRACKESGAEAVHPGYGFLSENALFADALQSAGLTFIGPPVDALTVMGDKIRSKNHVAGYGVPVVPGIAKPGLSDAELEAAAGEVGYPLLIKPSAGGGGKGMHVVTNPQDLAATLLTARRVAAAAFGDDTLFLERLVSTPRHIEVQVLADAHGNVIHLGERECSLQRRHQKVIEEAPSPLLESLPNGEAIRARIGEAACQAARSVSYTGAGTVEFLVSDQAPEEFFFMEMNTRLQVEHPVTEMVTGQDLVEWQVRIAAGQELALRQADVVLQGHAVEARVYAERPEQNFLPSSGTVLLLDEHAGNGESEESAAATGEPGMQPRVRVDSSLLPGLEVSSSYDPMLSKVIAWAVDRQSALDTLDSALAGYTALGIDTNVEYLRLLVNDADVRAGRLDTGLIERKLPDLAFRTVSEADFAAAALFLLAGDDTPGGAPGRLEAARTGPAALTGPWQRADGWRLGGRAPLRFSFAGPSGEVVTVRVTPDASSRSAGMVQVGSGAGRRASLHPTRPGFADLTLDGETSSYAFAATAAAGTGVRELFMGSGGWSCRLEVLDREARLAKVLAAVERGAGTADPEVRSPMTGTVVSLAVRDGDHVPAGQALLSVEAMKMEHQLTAELAGVVRLNVTTGDLVRAGQVLATIHPDPATTHPAASPDTNGKGDQP
ncbi:biotin carboxylase N-terminal domain-containing protein [Pseudarthrobacter sp. J75]|uniref:acetyl/propionyl/methylcrotonyl-CoA carboxylase subunit alpha n=1 Tax=unclassified Pseudarthrobacter TaxID=2647000 RepID=UPI002E8240A2|nr:MULTISPECIES: biotin carboxylase N-terminal domain-containing protein [unclassified Pseudarthrobacter]MEE2521779.1 biotin carboxylase N-terminal domain-containing protein [Pseudarthrobacter sp. J47]MEE2527856.1 biotin carboxylase N-terminal domain-containing protein [Pseudarthrobacter sp. J75]